MIVTTIDPVTGNKISDLEHHPFVVEGSGLSAMKIYFESEETKRTYLESQPSDDFFYHRDPPADT